MASYHYNRIPVQSSRGHSMVAAAAYRAAERLQDEKLHDPHDYTRKKGVIDAAILAPERAPRWVKDREELWNRAERVEFAKRKDAQLGWNAKMALPAEMTDEQRKALVVDFLTREFVFKGHVVDYAIHEPDRRGDQRNYHCHFLATRRHLTDDGFGELIKPVDQDQWKKVRSGQDIRIERKLWADYTNKHLQRAGIKARVDHRSFKDRGIEREPMQRMPVQEYRRYRQLCQRRDQLEARIISLEEERMRRQARDRGKGDMQSEQSEANRRFKRSTDLLRPGGPGKQDGPKESAQQIDKASRYLGELRRELQGRGTPELGSGAAKFPRRRPKGQVGETLAKGSEAGHAVEAGRRTCV